MKSRGLCTSPIFATRERVSISPSLILWILRSFTSLTKASQAGVPSDFCFSEMREPTLGLANKNSAPSSNPSAAESLTTIFSEGWRFPDSRCQMYGTDVLMRRAGGD
jgi:hypothetical protein